MRLLWALLKALLLLPLVLVLRPFRGSVKPAAPLPPVPDDVASFEWPALPSDGHITGRGATRADVTEGRAVFSLARDDGPAGEPLAIAIPQYALWFDASASRFEPVVVIQAERAGAMEFVGLRTSDGGTRVVTRAELHLLGTAIV